NDIVAPADATASPTAAQFYPRQWNLRAVFAPEAWAAGFLGSHDVVVAILDTGIDYSNPDLVGLVDLDRSISFVPEDVTRHYPGRLPFSDLFWHGTAVASAVRKGALVVSVPFNDAADLDHDGDIVRLPCEAANAVCVAATGPTGATGVNGPWVDVDAPAPYTAFGRSAIGVAAPGGTGAPG